MYIDLVFWDISKMGDIDLKSFIIMIKYYLNYNIFILLCKINSIIDLGLRSLIVDWA